jgi:hypothetical protein
MAQKIAREQVDLADRMIPGNARRWAILRIMAKGRGGTRITTSDIIHLHGWHGPPPAGPQPNGSPWQQATSRAAAEFRYMEDRGWVRRAWRVQTGARAYLQVWEITRKGREKLALVAAARRDYDRYGSWTDRQRRVKAAKQASRSRRRLIARAMRARYPEPPAPAARRVAAQWMRGQGLSLQEIGDVFGVTREMIRKDLLRIEAEQRHDAA